MKKILVILTLGALCGFSAPASADTAAPFAGKPLPWPAGSKVATASPEKFFPLTPGAHVQPLARGSYPARQGKPASAATRSADMTEEQARQLLAIYPVQK